MLNKIKINRGRIRDLEIDLHHKMNVITGYNGVGKTTVLDAIHEYIRAKSLNIRCVYIQQEYKLFYSLLDEWLMNYNMRCKIEKFVNLPLGLKSEYLSTGERRIMDIVVCTSLGVDEGRDTVVLIDDIEQHLHPLLQRKLITTLPIMFPHVQFILTSNSPHILTHVQPESVHMLIDDLDTKVAIVQPTTSYGANAIRIYEDIIGLHTTRPSEIQARLDKMFKLIEIPDFDAAEKMINELEMDIHDEPDLSMARARMARMIILAEE